VISLLPLSQWRLFLESIIRIFRTAVISAGGIDNACKEIKRMAYSDQDYHHIDCQHNVHNTGDIVLFHAAGRTEDA
jgi:hypothetical protein